MPDYGNPLYWQERYAADPSACFDWYMPWETIKPILAARRLLRPGDQDYEVLLPGCGNSRLPAQLSADGLTNVSCVDHSSVVISQLQARFQDLPEADFSTADVTTAEPCPERPDDVFDLVIDKGCMDAVLCGEDAFARAGRLVANMHRVLKPGGAYVVITFGEPQARMPFLTRAAWVGSPEVVLVPTASKGLHHVYIARKAE